MIYCDQDGVLADFDAGMREAGLVLSENSLHARRHEMTAAQLEEDDRVRQIMSQPGFFEWLRPMPDAHSLWEFMSRVSPGFPVLTARPRNDQIAPRVMREKRAMIHREFGPIPDSRFICCLASEKPNYVGYLPGPVQVLVDDRTPNCVEWIRAGGYAVLHTSAADSIKRMRFLLGEVGRLEMSCA